MSRFLSEIDPPPALAGLRFSSAATGIKYKGRDDLMVAHLCAGTALAGLFTRSRTRSAAVIDAETKLKLYRPNNSPVAFIVNSGNANAFTGQAGEATVKTLSQKAGEVFGCPCDHILTSSTGVIGEPLDPAPITRAFPQMQSTLSGDKIKDAAKAIMTTDTFAKVAFGGSVNDGEAIQIVGIAKGSGMIAPNMATMLAYIFTDARVEQTYLKNCLKKYANRTFNAITVDGDESTSDTLLIAATGQRGALLKSGRTKGARDFEEALHGVMRSLAHQIVRDGEGATKFIEVKICGAKTPTDARKIAFSVANSPLVKTAIAGEDANWGRIVMAIGKANAYAQCERITIYLGDICVASNGERHATYREEECAAYMRQNEINITIDIGVGKADFTAWTCDFTREYIAINADYRS